MMNNPFPFPRLLRRAAEFLAVLYLAVSIVGCAVLNAAMFHPPRHVYGPDLSGLIEMGPSNAPVAGVWMPVEGSKRAVPGANHDIVCLALRFPAFREAFEERFGASTAEDAK